MTNSKTVKYFNRDFDGLKNLLIDFSKTYYPTTYNDFSPSSPGMMLLETSAYIGDILSFYLDNQIQETFVQHARQSESIYNLAYMLGYRPKATKVATVEVDIYQQLPSTLSGSTYYPDYNYALYFSPGTQLKSATGNNSFLIEDTVDFSFSSSIDPTEVTVYQTSGGNPQYYLLKKKRKAISATIRTETVSFGTPTPFSTITLNDSNIIKIQSIVDSDGNNWYEVPYLGQEMIYKSVKNTNVNDPNRAVNADASQILKLEKTPRRFVTRLRSNNTLEIQFGSGTTSDIDEYITPNTDNVGLGLPYTQVKLTTAFDPTNFLQTDTYGIAPANTTLTITYLTGGGVGANVDSNELTVLSSTSNINFQNNNLNNITADYIFNTVATTNEKAASGGGSGDTLEEIRQNTLVSFQSQLRNVTAKDYLIRTLSLPPEYGSVAKAYIEPTKASDELMPGETSSTLNLYVLGYDYNKHLTPLSSTVKQNITTYLSEYRIIGDTVNIKDGFIINIGVNFEVVIIPSYNNNQVLNKCILAVQNYFKIDNQQFNQPIPLRDLYLLLDKVEGVQTVKLVEVTPKTGVAQGYSQYTYDTKGATKDFTLYPSLDPCVFEVKYPDTDIRGRVVPL